MLRSFFSTLVIFSILFVSSCKKNACEDVLCLNNGTCLDGTCSCPDGFTGANCEVDLCYNLCLNNGTCLDGTCSCPDGFTGTNCEINLCYNIECQNGGICNSGNCMCAFGYEGDRCQTEIRAKFLGAYMRYTPIGQGQSVVHSTSVKTNPEGLNKIYITYRGDCSADLMGDDFNTVVIPSQTITSWGETYTISGTGTISSSYLSCNITETVNGISRDTVIFGSK